MKNMFKCVRYGKSMYGFTLIELLVVISIIALLLAIILPSMQAVKRRASRTVCSANLHSIGLSIHCYANDNNTYLPTKDKWSNIGGWLFDVPKNVADDMKQEYGIETLYCPANSLKSKDPGELERWYSTYGLWALTDYFWFITFDKDWRLIDTRDFPFNTYYPEGSRFSNRRKIFISRFSDIKSPSTQPLVSDLVWTMGNTEPLDFTAVQGGVLTRSNHLDARTSEGGNQLKCDISVRWLDLEEMDENFFGHDNHHYW